MIQDRMPKSGDGGGGLRGKLTTVGTLVVVCIAFVLSIVLLVQNNQLMNAMSVGRIRSYFSPKIVKSTMLINNALLEMTTSNNILDQLLSKNTRDVNEESVQYFVRLTGSNLDISKFNGALFNALNVNNNVNNVAIHVNRLGKALEHSIIGTVSNDDSSAGILLSIRARPSEMSDLAKLASIETEYGSSIDWIGKVDPKFKSNLDFVKMQEMWENRVATTQVEIKEDTLEETLERLTRFESANTKLNRHTRAVSSSIVSHVSVFATIVPSLSSIYEGTEEEETQVVVDQLNKALREKFSTEIAKLSKDDDPLLFPVKKEGETRIGFTCSPKIAAEAMKVILNHEAIQTIERQLPYTLMNYYPNTIMQGVNAETPVVSNTSSNLFIWENGITGKGVVVGVADTGIDSDQCFFHDPENEVPVNTVNMDHRKIVSYQTVALEDKYGNIYKSDDQDSGDGHGTHVSGSVAGSILQTAENYNDLSKYNGAAPGAKLFFTDIMNTKGSSLLIPPDLYNYLFKIPYQKANVRIHSNSWGCSFSAVFNCKYNCNCKWNMDTDYGKKGDAVKDEFCKTMFGKSCCHICNTYDTKAQDIDKFTWDHDDFLVLFAAGNDGHTSDTGNIGSPTTSKNVLSVGASQTTNEGFVSAVDHVDFTSIFQAISVSNEEACCNFKGTSDDQTNLVKSLCCSEFMKKTYSDGKKYFTKENLAYFSGRGPAIGDRIKPDMVAPGYEIESMHSDGSLTTFQCGTGRPTPSNQASVLTLRGTSMATPLLAGAAALVREYFMTRTAHTNPSGPLVKATLIHSAQPLKGLVSLDGRGSMSDLKKMAYPNSFTGFGLVSLSSVLKFVGSTFELFTVDRKTIINGRTQNYCFRRIAGKSPSSGSTFLYATIAWYDMAATTSKFELYQDLDLNAYVFVENSTRSTRYPGNGASDNDHTNNVEKVRIEEIDDGMLVGVSITAYKLLKNQNYSLVITHSDDIESIGYCNPPAPWVPPIPVVTLLTILSVIAAVLILLVGFGILFARKYYVSKHGSGAPPTANNPQSTGGRRLGNGNDTEGWSIGRRLRDGIRLNDLISSRPQPQTETHVRLEDEDDMELQNGAGTVVMRPPNNNNRR